MTRNLSSSNTDGIRLVLVGTGAFGSAFIPIFQAHPLIRSVALADNSPERLAREAERHGIKETHPSFEAALRSDCDAIALFTPRHTHGPLALRALEAGKHVYSSVPAGMSLEEIRDIEVAVRKTGLTYMLGETSYYYPSTILCRELWRRGLFGRFVYGEGEYMHDMGHGFYEAFQHSGGAEWKRVAGIPPMYYPTHTASMIASVTGAHFTHVSCMGQRDENEDGIFRKGANNWDNEFSNETALLRASDGGMVRLNEFRRIGNFGGRSVRLSIFGTRGCFEEQPGGEVFSTHDKRIYNLSDLLRCAPISEADKERAASMPLGTQEDFYSGFASVHPAWRLPREFDGLPNGHHGSHLFLVDDFVRACATGVLPPNHIWAAARYNIPGFVAHESALRNGELLEIPDLGDPPPGRRFLEEDLATLAPSQILWDLPAPKSSP